MSLHPIVDRLQPSREQRPAIESRGRDVIVTAGAGTGKTRTLVARYLALVAELPEGASLRSIAAVTFTRKAAREMRNRVRDELRKYLLDPELAPAERLRWEARYAELDAARIGTIHSLCSEILRGHPAEAEVDPRFEVLDEGPVGILVQVAIDEALASAAADPDQVGLYRQLGERDLRAVLANLMAHRLDAAPALGLSPGDPANRDERDLAPGALLARWRQVLEARRCAGLHRLLASDIFREAARTLEENEAESPDEPVEVQRRAVLASLRRAGERLADADADAARSRGPDPGAVAGCVRELSILGSINLSGARPRSWPGGADQCAEVKGALRSIREKWKACRGPLEVEVCALDERLAEQIPAVRAAFAAALGGYERRKSERQALDNDDLEGRALRLLRQNGSVLGRWRADLTAILVDEFQDTNARQRALLDLLNGDAGRLFLVGDGKQSIYRFRGADVAVFRRTRAEVGERGGDVLALAESFRANPGLTRALNALLRPVLGDEPDPDRDWVEPFAPLAPMRECAAEGLSAPYVEVLLAVGGKGKGGRERAAELLAERIGSLVERGGVRVGDDSGRRDLGYGDVAILCRSSTSFAAYEDALESAAVPFVTVAGRGFHGRPEVRDLLNALAAVADPTDDLVLAGLLRSPAMGLSDEGLFRLRGSGRAVRGARDGASGELWTALGTGGATLPERDAEAARRARKTIAALHQRAGRQAVGDVLKAFLDVTDYRAALVRAGQHRAARNVAKLLDDAYASGIVGVTEFLAYVRSLEDVGAREGEARATAEGAVQLMSVHAAKGLEFPVVAIGDVTYEHRGGVGVVVDDELGVLLPLEDEAGSCPAVRTSGRERATDQEAAESDRLLYVAATRARELLVLNGCVEASSNGQLAKLSGWLGRLAVPLGLAERDPEGLDLEGAGRSCVALEVDGEPVACTIWGREHEPLGSVLGEPPDGTAEPPSDRPLADMLEAVRPAPVSTDEDSARLDRDPPPRVWRVVPAVRRPAAPAWVVGAVVHEALAAWRQPDRAFEDWVAGRARGYGVADPATLADCVRRSRMLLERFRASRLFGELDSADSRLTEMPFSRLGADGVLEVGVIDVAYLRDGAWTIVDYKTDALDSAGELDRQDRSGGPAVRYRSQVLGYARAFQDLVGVRPRALLCWLDVGGSVQVVEVRPPGQPGG